MVEVDTYDTGVVADGKVSGLATGLGRPGLLEVGGLAQVVVHQLLLKGLIRSFGEHRLFFEDG